MSEPVPPLPFVRSTLHLAETPSTNDLARAEAPEIAASLLPRLYRADRQTRGRGRGANSWWSAEGSLLISILIDPSAHSISPRNEPRAGLATGLAVLGSVRRYINEVEIGIRWPNDVEIEGRKVAGILVERITIPGATRLILGIGVNVSTRVSEAPADVAAMATSIEAHASGPLGSAPLDRVLTDLLERLGTEFSRLAADDPTQIADLNHFDLLAGRVLSMDLGPTMLRGIGRGIAPDGALLVEAEGSIRPIHGGRVLR